MCYYLEWIGALSDKFTLGQHLVRCKLFRKRRYLDSGMMLFRYRPAPLVTQIARGRRAQKHVDAHGFVTELNKSKRLDQLMLGVVLWSDLKSGKAVIWCEDHGDLAFMHEQRQDGMLSLDPGDLVKFDLKINKQLRYASNPELVTEGYSSELAASLTQPVPAPDAFLETADILPFPHSRIPQGVFANSTATGFRKSRPQAV